MKAQGWEQRLAAEIEAARGRPLTWGEHDCVTWAVEVAAALRGEPSPVDWRGRYSTPLGGLRLMRKRGYENLDDAVRAVYGRPLPTPLRAQRGDLVLSHDEALGICIGAQAAFVSERGLVTVQLRHCRAAWRV